MTPSSLPLPAHASEKRARRSRGIGVALVVAGIAMACIGVGLRVYPITLAGAGLATIGVRRMQRASRRIVAGRAFVLAQHAQAAVLAGDLDRAEELLAAMPPNASEGARRGAMLLSALVDVRRGDLARSEPTLMSLLSFAPTDTLSALQSATACGMQALVLGATGRTDEASRLVTMTLASPHALKEARLFAHIAWGVVLERTGRRADLREHLELHRSELFAAAGPSERRLLRAWARMLEMPPHSVYREAPAVAEEAEAAFVRAVSPEAARFADEPARDAERARALLGEAPPDEDEQGSEARAGRAVRIAIPAGGALLLGVAFGVRELLRGGAPLRSVEVETAQLAMVAGVATLSVVVLGLVAWVARRRGVGKEASIAVFEAYRALGANELERARVLAASAASSGIRPLVAQAEQILAQVALARAAPERALAHADRGLAALSGEPELFELASDTLAADLVTARALALAATDRPESAKGALSKLPESAFVLSQRFAVELQLALRAGDLGRAAELA
ncbi:MAG TPA: hypothetical protein VL400_17075, partial [Polyangiaceae bacterium]|nr:hypothetical protein [Polyangiaceae bacterium]